MSSTIENQTIAAPKSASRTQAYVELTKLRISVMVLLTFAVAAFLAAAAGVEGVDGTIQSVSIHPGMFVCALLGMLLIASSGNAMNMFLERYSDFLMPRTASRPLPDQRLSATEVAIFSAVTLGVGTALLLATVNWQTAACGILNWVLYVFIYTPLKRKTHWNTEIGAVAGALPILMGSLAVTASVGLIGWAFFAVLFLWQFPHFMAIAWIYRHQYRQGGLKMLTVTEPTGVAAGRKAIVTGVLLIAVSLIPMACTRTNWHAGVFAIVAVLLGVYYLKAAINFSRLRTDIVARKLLRISILYLPLYMVALLIACLT